MSDEVQNMPSGKNRILVSLLNCTTGQHICKELRKVYIIDFLCFIIVIAWFYLSLYGDASNALFNPFISD